MSDNFDAALKTGAYTVDVEAGPVMGTPAQGYQQPQTYQAGYPVQAGYPTQGWPAGVPPGYGSPNPFPAPYGAQPYPYPPPPPIGGGSDDEKFQISDVGMCTIVPGLERVNYRWLQILVVGMFVVLGSTLFGLAVWLVSLGIAGASISLWIVGAFVWMFAVLFVSIMRRSRPAVHPRITEEAIAKYIERVTKIGATLPQLNAVKALMSQANPNTPHEFQVWKSGALATDGTSRRSAVVSALFGTQNLPAGQKAQLHLYTLM